MCRNDGIGDVGADSLGHPQLLLVFVDDSMKIAMFRCFTLGGISLELGDTGKKTQSYLENLHVGGQGELLHLLVIPGPVCFQMAASATSKSSTGQPADSEIFQPGGQKRSGPTGF